MFDEQLSRLLELRQNASKRPPPEQKRIITDFSAKEIAVGDAMAREDFEFYCRWIMLRSMGIRWQRAKHHTIIAQYLRAVFDGIILRLIISMPPRYSKTQFVENFLEWTLGKVPDSEYIYLSYGSQLAADKTGEALRNVRSDAYRSIFPDVVLTRENADDWKTSKGGRVYAAGTSGTITGIGAGKMRDGWGGALIFDDPHKPDEVFGPVREKVIRNFQNTVENRLNWASTPIIVIAHMLHVEDLPSWLRAGRNGETWVHLNLAAICDDGTALWPEKHPIETLRRMQKSSPYVFASQYMGSPTAVGGNFFTRAHLAYPVVHQDDGDGFTQRSENISYKGVQPEDIPVLDCVYAVVDSASKTGETHDGLGVTFYGLRPADEVAQGKCPLIILDWNITQIEAALLEEWLPNAVMLRLQELTKEFRVLQGSAGVFIEDKNSGTVLLQQGRNYGWPVTAIDNDMVALSKTGRCVNVSGYVQSGKVKFLQAAYDKVVDYKGFVQNHMLTQVLTFSPSTGDQGADDLLDCFSYGIAIGLGNPEGF
jgi:hypothetical protein